MRNQLSEAFSNFKEILPILLSHHPPCETYKDHTINIGRVKLCIGCFIGYPSAILSILILMSIYNKKEFNTFPILIIGIFFVLFQFLSLTRLTEIKVIKIFQKLFMGTGSGFIIVYLYYILQLPEIIKIIVIYGIMSIILIPIGFLHYRTSVKTCKNCEIKRIPGKCPEGFSFENMPL